jgi:hypothetical protein
MLTPRDHRRSRFSGPGFLSVVLVLGFLFFADARPVQAQGSKPAPGEMRWGLHVTLAARWLDPAETEAFSTPFMVMYAIHDAMLKPMPAGLTTATRCSPSHSSSRRSSGEWGREWLKRGPDPSRIFA